MPHRDLVPKPDSLLLREAASSPPRGPRPTGCSSSRATAPRRTVLVRAPAMTSPPRCRPARSAGLTILATSRDEARSVRARERGAHRCSSPATRLPVKVDTVIATVGPPPGPLDPLVRPAATSSSAAPPRVPTSTTPASPASSGALLHRLDDGPTAARPAGEPSTPPAPAPSSTGPSRWRTPATASPRWRRRPLRQDRLHPMSRTRVLTGPARASGWR